MANNTKTKKRVGTRLPIAMSMLAADHKAVSKLFKRYEQAEDREEKRAILQEVCTALTVHAQLEEELFYPALRTALSEDDVELLDEAQVEHSTVKILVSELEDAEPGEELVDAKVTVLCEYVKHHVKEEEDEIFPKAKRAKELDFDDLGERMQARKIALEAEAGVDNGGDGGNGNGPQRRRRSAAAVGARV